MSWDRRALTTLSEKPAPGPPARGRVSVRACEWPPWPGPEPRVQAHFGGLPLWETADCGILPVTVLLRSFL